MSYFCKRRKVKRHCSKLFGTIWYFTQLVVQASFIVRVHLDPRASFIVWAHLASCASFIVVLLGRCYDTANKNFNIFVHPSPTKRLKHKFLRSSFVKDILRVCFLWSKINRPYLWFVFTMQKEMGAKKSKHKFLRVMVCKGQVESGHTCRLCPLCKKDAHKKLKAQIFKVVVCKGHIESLFSFI